MIVREQKNALKKGTIGLISDTHGLVRPQALAALKGVDVIVHAGDIGKSEVLEELRKIAPLYVIRGNNDRDSWAKSLPDILKLRCGEIRIQVIHNVHDLAENTGADYDAIISGHSHKPGIQTRDGTLYVNPGSAGPRRFKLPIAVGKLRISGRQLEAELVELNV